MQWLCLSAGGLVGAFLVLLEVQWLTWLWLWGCLVVNLLAALTRSIAFDRVWQIHQEQARRKRIAS
jgi:fluoride ion exporter CrcB/FEX